MQFISANSHNPKKNHHVSPIHFLDAGVMNIIQDKEGLVDYFYLDLIISLDDDANSKALMRFIQS